MAERHIMIIKTDHTKKKIVCIPPTPQFTTPIQTHPHRQVTLHNFKFKGLARFVEITFSPVLHEPSQPRASSIFHVYREMAAVHCTHCPLVTLIQWQERSTRTSGIKLYPRGPCCPFLPWDKLRVTRTLGTRLLAGQVSQRPGWPGERDYIEHFQPG